METVPNEVVNELRIVHGLSERDAASLVMTVMGVATLTLKTRPAPKVSRCPFRDPANKLGPDDLCPVCGLGSQASFDDVNAKCVD